MAHAAGCEVISDDLNAVLLSDGEVRVNKLPFTGTFSEANCKQSSYSLGGVFYLEKDEFNSIEIVSRAKSLASLMLQLLSGMRP